MAPESFLVGFAGFGVYTFIYLLLLRTKLSAGWFVLQVLTGILVFVASAGFGFRFVDGFSFFYALSIFGFFWFCFFFVTSIFYVSVSVGIIHYLTTQPGNSSTIEELYQECIRKPFTHRVQFMEKLGAITHSEQGYLITDRGERTVRRIKNLQNALGLKSRGYYSNNLKGNENSILPD
jgi:hypothetical protein